ncbi:hypothetical protein [Halomarina oriensis]|uniref:Uncharacterized protein n=1 Tax=Halomarina oriensis TaxID=671145 RepID=A0A6B0GMU0_9EURY|nr:hypothetical protein [Halomarina oriensis]MWG35980.1 hypothetical protein [Halomarina oriensis]
MDDGSPRGEPTSTGSTGAQRVDIEVMVADGEDRPTVEDATRIDVAVGEQLYPTAKLQDGRYVAWWFDAHAPAADSQTTTEWVVGPTRFLAAATLGELWEDPRSFETLTAKSGN